MPRTPLIAVLLAAGSSLGCGSLFAQCEASAPVHRIIDQVRDLPQGGNPAERDARMAAILNAGLTEYPGDYFLLRYRLLTRPDPETRIAWAKAQRANHPEDPVFDLIEAQSLVGRDTPAAIRRMQALQAAHPEMGRPGLELASIATYGKFKDKARVQSELDSFIQACPTSATQTFLDLLVEEGSPQQVALSATMLRRRLDTQADTAPFDDWSYLWQLEFKTRPVAEHGEVRKLVAADLLRLEKAPRRKTLDWMNGLQGGYQTLGDQVALERSDDEILETYPQSSDALRISQQRWRKEHPVPRPGDPKQDEAYGRLILAQAREHKRWPDEMQPLNRIFTNLVRQSGATPGEIAKAVDDLIEGRRKSPGWTTLPLPEFRIAEAYMEYKIGEGK